LLPVGFKRAYPNLDALIQRCWAPKNTDRPNFDEIVRIMQNEVAAEVRRWEEPEIEIYSVEADSIYHERLGVDEVFVDEGGEGERKATVEMVKKEEFNKVVAELNEKNALLEKKGEMMKEMMTKVKELQTELELKGT